MTRNGKLIAVSAPAMAWEPGELWRVFPPLAFEVRQRGLGHVYHLTLDKDTAVDLRRYCEEAEGARGVNAAERAALRKLSERIEVALSRNVDQS